MERILLAINERAEGLPVPAQVVPRATGLVTGQARISDVRDLDQGRVLHGPRRGAGPVNDLPDGVLASISWLTVKTMKKPPRTLMSS